MKVIFIDEGWAKKDSDLFSDGLKVFSPRKSTPSTGTSPKNTDGQPPSNSSGSTPKVVSPEPQ